MTAQGDAESRECGGQDRGVLQTCLGQRGQLQRFLFSALLVPLVSTS